MIVGALGATLPILAYRTAVRQNVACVAFSSSIRVNINMKARTALDGKLIGVIPNQCFHVVPAQ